MRRGENLEICIENTTRVTQQLFMEKEMLLIGELIMDLLIDFLKDGTYKANMMWVIFM